MKLGSKVCLVIPIAWMLMFMVVCIGIKIILINHYYTLENQAAQAIVSRVKTAFERKAMDDLTEKTRQKILRFAQVYGKIVTIPELADKPALHNKYLFLQTTKANVLLDRINEDSMDVYSLLTNKNGQVSGLLKLSLYRDVYQTGKQGIARFLALFLLSGTVFTLVLIYLLRHIVINPLQRINQEIVHIRETGSFATAIPVTGTDELAVLGEAFNKMFDTIDNYETRNRFYLQKVNFELNQTHVLEQKLRKADGFLTDIIHSMPSILIIVDKDLRIKQWNLQAEKVSKTSTDAAKKSSIFILFPWLVPYKQKIEEIISSQKSLELPRIQHQSEGLHYYKILLFPLTGAHGLVIRMDDVTEWVKMEEILLQNDKLATLGVLATGVAHAIETPVKHVKALVQPLHNHVVWLIEVLKNYLAVETKKNTFSEPEILTQFKEAEQILDDMESRASSMASIVKTLQSFARLDENVQKLTNIHEGLDSVLQLLDYKFRDKIIVVKDYGNVPLIHCFPGKLNQTLMGLIFHALKDISEKGSLEITTRAGKKNIMITIQERSARPCNDKVQKEHWLSLSTIRTAIEDMDGTLRVEMVPDEGIKIIIILPI